MFDRTITLFNHLDGQWLVSVIPDVSLVEKKSSELKSGETNNVDADTKRQGTANQNDGRIEAIRSAENV